jgi:hypothetical protein
LKAAPDSMIYNNEFVIRKKVKWSWPFLVMVDMLEK